MHRPRSKYWAGRLTPFRIATAVYDKQALIDLVREKALKFGDFTLASGKKAKYYLDGKHYPRLGRLSSLPRAFWN